MQSQTVCILLLSRKPVVVSSSRLFAPGHSGVTPRASYLVLEIGLSVMHAAADTLSKLTSDISVFHRDPRFDVISIIRNRLLRFYVCTLSCAEARAGSSRSSRRKNHISNSKWNFVLNQWSSVIVSHNILHISFTISFC